MSKLYDISAEYKELVAMSEDDDEMALAIADTLEGIEGEFNDKANAIVSMVLNMDGDVEPIDSAIARLQARKKVIQNKQASLKNYLRENMERTGIKKISCPLFTITCVPGREIAYIDNEEALPDDYLSVKTTISPDKTAITKALKDGTTIEGAHLERAKSSIRIK
jgi:hypothetical protein